MERKRRDNNWLKLTYHFSAADVTNNVIQKLFFQLTMNCSTEKFDTIYAMNEDWIIIQLLRRNTRNWFFPSNFAAFTQHFASSSNQLKRSSKQTKYRPQSAINQEFKQRLACLFMTNFFFVVVATLADTSLFHRQKWNWNSHLKVSSINPLK